MNTQNTVISSAVSIEGTSLDRIFSASRTKYFFAHVLMVAGYACVVVNPFDDSAFSLGFICEGVALLLYVFSQQNPET